MAIRRRRADARPCVAASAKVNPAAPFCAIRLSAACSNALFQIAVMIAALGAALFLAPAHVNDFYMSRAQGH